MKEGLFLCLLLQLVAIHLARASDPDDSLHYVSRECKSKLLNINSLDKIKEFLRHYRDVINGTERPKKSFLHGDSGLGKCFDQKEQLLELDQIISDQGEGVCRNEYINKLVNFHMNYVLKGSKQAKDADPSNTKSSFRKTYAAYIFSLLAHQVSYVCKSRLLERVGLLESSMECGDVLESFLPLDIITGNSAEEEMRMKFNEFLSNFKRVEDFSLMFGTTKEINPYYSVVVSSDASAKINNLKMLCKTREPYYKALFSPVSSLSQLGYDVNDTSVDSQDLNSASLRKLKCWLATAQLCQGILRVHVRAVDSEDLERVDSGDKHFVEIKFDKPPNDVEQSFDAVLPNVLQFRDFVGDISPEIVRLVNKKKSLATKFKRTLQLAKKMLVNNVKVDPNQNKMAGHFMDALTRGEDDLDAAVAYGGKPVNTGLYTASRLVADDTDTILAISSFFVNPTVSLVLNSCVAIGLTAAFVVCTVSASMFGAKQAAKDQPEVATGNFKEYYRNKLEERMNAANAKHQRKGFAQKVLGEVYVGQA